jgi:hypothetical protein
MPAMKTILLFVLAATLFVSGCASTGDGNPKPDQNSSKNPEVGMTKQQVLDLYGKTDNMQISSAGETWIYHLNMGEAFIPFNFGYRPRTRVVHFDPAGKVASWSYTK